MNNQNTPVDFAGSVAKKALTEAETAIYISMSQSFLRQARMNGDRIGRAPGPPFLRIGRAIRYLREDLDTWLDQFRITSSLNGEGR